MIQAIRNPVTFDEFIAWYPENSEHRYELHDGVIVERPKPFGKHSEIAELLSLIKSSKQPPVHLHLFVSGGKLVISPITPHIRTLWKERQNYLAAIARRVLSLVGFRPSANPKIFFLQGIDWIILNRIVGGILQPAAACSHKFAHDIFQEVRPMR